MEQTVLSINDDKMTTRGELIEYPAELIGGRNLISNIPNNWAKGYYHPTTGAPAGSGANHNSLKERISCEPNSYYTMSSPKRMVALQYDEDDVYIPPIIDKGENKTLTFKTHSSARYLRFFILFVEEPNELNLIGEYKLKIEKGNKATDWTPAPEDLGLSYPNWVTEFKPSISENGILAPKFDESGVLSFSINRTTAQEFIENPNL